MTVNVVGAGLAGCECAWQLAKRGIKVKLFEMKPEKFSPAHSLNTFAELVCSNSLRAAGLENAVLYLPSEMRERITVCGSIDGADYVFVNPTYYAIADYCDELFVNVSNMEQCAAVRHGKNELTAIYAVNKE